MSKSSNNSYTPLKLAEMPTWRSGILQASMQRSMKRLSDNYLKQYDLTTNQWLIIGTIYEAGGKGLTTTQLMNKLDTTMGYLTNALNILEAKKMIARSSAQSDSRVKLLTIPRPFQKKCAKIESGLRDVFRATVYSRVSRQELENYIIVMQKLSDIS